VYAADTAVKVIGSSDIGTECGVCGAIDVSTLWDLPDLPLSECFGAYDPEFPSFDQALQQCDACGHMQLRKCLQPSDLYTQSEYAYRSTKATGTPLRVKSFTEFCLEQVDSNEGLSVVDIGGNDQALLNAFSVETERLELIDPIRMADNGKIIDGVVINGCFVEEMNLDSDLRYRPSLVVCAHTLEHIEKPIYFLRKIFQECPPNCVFVFEVPCASRMIENARFDAIFHQHLHYFSLRDLERLITRAGGMVTSYRYNAQPTLGGSIMVACKSHVASGKNNKTKLYVDHDAMVNVEALSRNFFEKKRKFQNFMKNLRAQIIERDGSKLYGYGASLMLPNLLYHLDLPAETFSLVIDDDQQKDGWQYKNLNLSIRFCDSEEIIRKQKILVTSVENANILYERARNFEPERIYLPVIK
tara:strand:- start:22359 stop:23603 length:1245 start_codon:yes stop_codon:yes gene_type:complete